MNTEARNSRDVWAGLMLAGIGGGAIFVARDYRFGSTLHMGPGYFPSLLGGLLVVFGISIAAMGLRNRIRLHSRISLRALILLPLSLVLFGEIMAVAGFIPALLVLVFVAALSGNEFKLLEVIFLALGLTALSVVMFVWGLGLPYPLIQGF